MYSMSTEIHIKNTLKGREQKSGIQNFGTVCEKVDVPQGRNLRRLQNYHFRCFKHDIYALSLLSQIILYFFSPPPQNFAEM
jgi:hypothetical protein